MRGPVESKPFLRGGSRASASIYNRMAVLLKCFVVCFIRFLVIDMFVV